MTSDRVSMPLRLLFSVDVMLSCSSTMSSYCGFKFRMAWDHAVKGGDRKDIKFEWIGIEDGQNTQDQHYEAARVIHRTRSMRGYVGFDVSRFINVANKKAAACFLLQRMT